MNKTCLVNQTNPPHIIYKFLDYFIKTPNLENNTRKNIMKNYLLLFLFASILLSCTNNSAPESIASKIESSSIDDIKHNLDFVGDIDSSDWEWGIYYVIVSDTSEDYQSLRSKMLKISEESKIKIDSLDRSFDKSKGRLVLPEDYEDEIYAGENYPRRFESDYLSIEYLNFYIDKCGENTMAIIEGIYEDKVQADSAYAAIRKFDDKALFVRSKMFVGCMH